MAMAMTELGQRAKAAAPLMATAPTAAKNEALMLGAEALETEAEAVLAANARDVAAARSQGISETLIDRLRLDEKRLGLWQRDCVLWLLCPILWAKWWLGMCGPTGCGFSRCVRR